jgi:hypothetical protein
LLDVAPRLPLRILHRVFTRAWRKRLTTPRRVPAHLDRYGGKGVRGTTRLRSVVRLYHSVKRCPGDDYEADLLWLLIPALEAAGIEPPELQFTIKIFDGRAEATVDFAWPRRKKLIEVEGLDTHADYEAGDYDNERAAEVRALGWDLRVVAPKAINERPDATVARLVRLES